MGSLARGSRGKGYVRKGHASRRGKGPECEGSGGAHALFPLSEVFNMVQNETTPCECGFPMHPSDVCDRYRSIYII